MAKPRTLSKRHRLIWLYTAVGLVPVALVLAALGVRAVLEDETYVPDQDEEGITRALDRSGAAGESPLRFTDATREAGIAFVHFPFERTSQIPEDMGPGAAWGDYDADGDPDLFLVNFAGPVGTPADELAASGATDRLYRNEGDGTFFDVTESAGVGRAHFGMGAAWGDYDADGHLDLLVTAWGDPVLWRGRGDGSFEDATAEAGVAGHGFWAGASWADFDQDGDLDVYVVGYVQYAPEPGGATRGDPEFPFTLNPSSYAAEPNRLFVNRGDGTFVDRAEAAGVLDPEGRGMSAAWVDLDQDGWLDLYVANDVSDNRLYRNLGDGTFEDRSYRALVADYRGAMGIAVGDWDGDLDQDLFITHWIAQENALYSNMLSQLGGTAAAGELNFSDESDRFGLGQISLDLIGWGTSFSDFDNDGWLDLYVTNGSTMQRRDDHSRLTPMDPHLYSNRGGTEGFYEVGEAAGFRTETPLVGRGGAVADYDRDGDLDVVVMHVGGPAKLFRNDSERGHWLGMRLLASTSHPSAIGARVTVFAGGRAHLREVGSEPSYISQNDTEVMVGLGGTAHVDSVAVVWPGGGRQVLTGLAADRRYVLVEAAEPRVVASRLTREQTVRFWQLDAEVAASFNTGDWESAIEGLQELLGLDPDHEDSLYDLGNALLEVGRYAEAVDAWERLLEVNAASSRAWIQLGIVRSMPRAADVFDLGEAVRAFEAAHDLNREESNPVVLWGEAALARGDRATAARLLEAGYRMNDRSVAALYLSGYLSWSSGRAQEAGALLSAAIAASEGIQAVHGASGEGDTRSERMAEVRRLAATRRLFSGCLEALRAVDVQSDPDRLYPCVDEELRRIAG